MPADRLALAIRIGGEDQCVGLLGFVSDRLTPVYGADSLRWSLFLFGAINFWVAWHYYIGGKHLTYDLARANDLVR